MIKKYLGLDIGKKKIGVAISESGIIAREYGTLEIKNQAEAIRKILEIINKEKVNVVVAGLPLDAEGKISEKGRQIQELISELQKLTPGLQWKVDPVRNKPLRAAVATPAAERISNGVDFIFKNEYLTTKEAERVLRQQGFPLKEIIKRSDSLAAKIILEEYLAEKPKWQISNYKQISNSKITNNFIVRAKLRRYVGTESRTNMKPEKINSRISKIAFKNFLAKGLIFFIAAVLGAGAGLGFFLTKGLNLAVDKNNKELVNFEIKPGQGKQEIAQNLEKQGLILSRWPFLFYVWLKNYKVKAGLYILSPSMTTLNIIDQVAQGKIKEHKITIPEGWRITQIAEYLDKNGIVNKDDFLRAAKYDPVRYTLPEKIELKPGASLEGLLFPDTYRLALDATSKDIVELMMENYKKKIEELKPTYEQIILASIVEREAKFDEDRAKMAGVYQNRINKGMKLEADPTIQYAKGNWDPITREDIETVNSLYNTYKTISLPPTPIANPGLKSIKAAVSPEKHNYYFFFNLEDGKTIYSKTKSEHDANLRKYANSE